MVVSESLTVTLMVWVAGLCSWAATLMSLAAVWSHCKNYSQPNLQRWVIRIIMMVPIYALTAWASLVWVDSAYYLDTVRDIYEAFVIYCFVSLLIAYFDGERAFLVAMHDHNPTALFWPASLMRKDLDLGDPYDYLFLKRGILQYVVVKPILAGSTMALKSLDVYHEGDWSPSDGYIWTQLIYNCSVSLSLYCLVVFYMATRESLAQWNPLPKFLCIKAIVFFSYWQGLGISILVGLGLIHDTSAFSAEHIATFLQSWLICLEMIGGAFGHWFSFSYLDYIPSSRLAGRVRLFHAIRDALGFKDVIIDAKNAWSGHQYTYKYFDPTVPVEDCDRLVLQPARPFHGDPDSVSLAASESSSSGRSTQVRPGSESNGVSTKINIPADASEDIGGLAERPSLATETVSNSSSNGGGSNSFIKERRLRAGMRYTQGGKKTYWLPVDPVDHRAVAFSSGGAGRTRSKLLYGMHGAGSSARAAVEYIGSSVHSSSRAMQESRRNHRHATREPLHERTRLLSPGAAEYGVSQPSMVLAPLTMADDELADISMDLDADERADDDAIYNDARQVEGDFNYPVIEIGVAFGFSRRRPYGHTIPRSSTGGASSSTPGSRPRLQRDQFSNANSSNQEA